MFQNWLSSTEFIKKNNTEVICQNVFRTHGGKNPRDVFCGMLTVCYKCSRNSVWCSTKNKTSLQIGKIFGEQEWLHEFLKFDHMYKRKVTSVLSILNIMVACHKTGILD